MGRNLLVSVGSFMFLIALFRNGVEGRFEGQQMSFIFLASTTHYGLTPTNQTLIPVAGGPCYPGTLFIPDNCRSCLCDLFGSQFYCINLCPQTTFQRKVRPRTTQKPRTTTTIRTVNATSRSFQSKAECAMGPFH